VSGPRGEFGTEILLQFEPLAIATHLAAPTANPQELFQIVQALQQPPRGHMDPGPDQQNYQSPQRGPVPIRGKWLSENKMWNPDRFRQPCQQDQNREAKRFNPENGIPTFFRLIHGINLAHGGVRVQKMSFGDARASPRAVLIALHAAPWRLCAFVNKLAPKCHLRIRESGLGCRVV